MLEGDPGERGEEQLSVIDAAMRGTDLGFEQWQNLAQEVRAVYCRALTVRNYDGGETVYGNGSGVACEGVVVILDGAVEVTNRSLSIPHHKGRKNKREKDVPDGGKASNRRSSLNHMMAEIRGSNQFKAKMDKGGKGSPRGRLGEWGSPSERSPRGRGGDSAASGESEEDAGLNDSRERWVVGPFFCAAARQ